MVIRITKPELTGMPAEVRKLLNVRPFVPFRLAMRDGRMYDIQYPEMNLVTNVYMVIGFPAAGDRNPVYYDRTETVRFDDVASVVATAQLAAQ